MSKAEGKVGEKLVEAINVDLGCDLKCDECEKFFECTSPAKEEIYKKRRMAKAKEKMRHIKHKIVVTGGKGGVGKSFIATNIATALAMRGFKVSVLDQDFDGRAIPKMFGVRDKVLRMGPKGVIPVEGPLGIQILSTGNMRHYTGDGILTWFFRLRKNATEELLANVNYGERDFLVVDLPPGTSADAVNVMMYIPDLDGMVDVTVPSIPSQGVARRAALLAMRAGIRVFGIVENMSDFICPDCGMVIPVFQRGGADMLSKELKIPILGRIPLDHRISASCDEGVPFVYKYPDSPAGKAIISMTEKLIEMVEKGG